MTIELFCKQLLQRMLPLFRITYYGPNPNKLPEGPINKISYEWTEEKPLLISEEELSKYIMMAEFKGTYIDILVMIVRNWNSSYKKDIIIDELRKAMKSLGYDTYTMKHIGLV